MTCCRARAVSIGPAAACALSAGAGGLRVHSVFSTAVNLEADGARWFASLCGPRGRGLPHAIALERASDLDAWRVAAGTPARVVGGALRLTVEGAPAVVDLAQAERPPAPALPAIRRLGRAYRACAARLAATQRDAGCDLRIDALGCVEAAPTPLGESLRDAALSLGDAGRASLRQAVAGLVGLGAGLTPSGDDFLCGFMAAARASWADAALVDALGDAIRADAERTGAMSAFLLRCSALGLWPAPLVDLAGALAREREAESLAALGALCGLGHSSGADLATGFLFGLRRRAHLHAA
jgi:hypothetical protein